jgi:RNA polymerase sigma-70 factor (ECF subfamily)
MLKPIWTAWRAASAEALPPVRHLPCNVTWASMAPTEKKRRRHKTNHRPVALSNPDTWLDQHGDALYRYAILRVREPATAEDLVQETLLSALRARDSFAGAAAERTWLIAILKNKIIDYYRRHRHEAPLPETDDPDAAIEAMFNEADENHWAHEPAAWSNPDAALEQSEFWRAFQLCLEQLPPRQAQVFTLTEVDGLDTEELCKVLAAQPSNVWVMLHRARLRLRECLEQKWFGATTGKR